MQGASHTLLEQMAHRAEIQDVTLAQPHNDGSAVLAAVDCYGRATVAHLRPPEQNDYDADESPYSSGAAGAPIITEIQPLSPDETLIEAGWAGIALAPDQPSQAAIARHFAKDVTVFDGPMAVRTINTMYNPNAVLLLSPILTSSTAANPLVAVAEGPQVSIWDMRAAGRGGRVAKLSPSGPHSGHLLCLGVSDGGAAPVLGAAGTDRSVIVWEPRKWTIIDRWNNCLKYEATSLHFSSRDSGQCFACGLDYEVVSGRWDGARRSRLGGGHRTGASTKQAIIAGQDNDSKSDGGGVPLNAAGAPHGSGVSLRPSKTASVSFRGDSRWLGLAKAKGQDVLAGWTASGQLYVAEFGPTNSLAS